MLVYKSLPMKLCHPFHSWISEVKSKSSHLRPSRMVFRTPHSPQRVGELTHPARETGKALLTAAAFSRGKLCPGPAQLQRLKRVNSATCCAPLVPAAGTRPGGDRVTRPRAQLQPSVLRASWGSSTSQAHASDPFVG